MFSRLRDPQGRFTLFAVALACFALAVMLAFAGTIGQWLAILLAVAGLGAALGGWWQQRHSRYDLDRLWESEPALRHEPEPIEPEGDPDTPYCAWCDEPYPPGTHRCRTCGRPLQ